MQKIITVLALIVGLATALPVFNNASLSVNATIVGNKTDNDTVLQQGRVRLVSSGNDLLLQGLGADSSGSTNGTQRTIATKDLSASKSVSNITVTTPATEDAGTVTYRDSTIQVTTGQDTNKINQVNLRRYKLTNGASNNAVAVTTFKNDSTLTVLSVNVHTHSNRVYAQVLQVANGVSSLLLVGSDLDGKNGKTITLTNGTTPEQVSCTGVAGSDKLYCAWTVGTALFEASVDPSKDQGNNSASNSTVTQGAQVIAWATSATVGTIQVSGANYAVRSVNANATKALTLPTPTATLSKRNIFPRNENLAIVWSDANTYTVDVLDKNGDRNSTAQLVTGAEVFQLVQHKNGAVYALAAPADLSLVYVAQVQGDIHLSAFTLQAAVYACFALVAALFVF